MVVSKQSRYQNETRWNFVVLKDNKVLCYNQASNPNKQRLFMTPAVLQPLFEQWRNENLSFCVTSKNYNKSNNLIEANSAGGGGVILSLSVSSFIGIS